MNRAGSPATRHHAVNTRMVLASGIAGVLLAALSVPVAMAVTNRFLRTRNATTFDGRYWLQRQGNASAYEAWVYMHRDPFMVHWQSSLVTAGAFDPPPTTEFDRPPTDPRPRFARRDHTGHDQSIIYEASGWPLPAAAGRVIMDGSPATVWGEWQLPVRVGPLSLAIPLRPIWTGLLGNTLFYGSITLALLIVLRHARTRRRRARGRCIACGYELGEGVATCPECGLHL